VIHFSLSGVYISLQFLELSNRRWIFTLVFLSVVRSTSDHDFCFFLASSCCRFCICILHGSCFESGIEFCLRFSVSAPGPSSVSEFDLSTSGLDFPQLFSIHRSSPDFLHLCLVPAPGLVLPLVDFSLPPVPKT
jgi:hypothetical protein